MNRATACIVLSGIVLTFPQSGLAYMGPTLGLGIVGTVLAVIAVSLLSLAAFVIIPIRRMLKKSREKTADEDPDLRR